MKIIELNREQLNSFLIGQKFSQFLQSYEWSEFQESVGQKVFRFGVEEEGKIISVITFFKKSIGLGRVYFYAPRGPIIFGCKHDASCKLSDEEILDFILEEIKKIARQNNCIFLRFDPVDQLELKNYIKTIDVQPSKTLILDLSKSEEDLLKEMHQKTRYNIRLAEKKGVAIREAGIDEFEKFWELMSETVERDGFRLHDKEYYQKMLQSKSPERSVVGVRVMSDELKIKLYFAEYNGKVITANIIDFFGDMVTYVHGSSSNQDRSVMAPYLLQWEIIKQAKNLGYKHYDFYGIDENKWPGVTRFKKGFGGAEVNYPGTFDVVFDSTLYNVYKLFRWLRRKF